MVGTLEWLPALSRKDLLAVPVLEAVEQLRSIGETSDRADQVMVAEIDPDLADTHAFCETYGVDLDISANCVVVAGKRGGQRTLAACVVLATTRADVNGIVRRHLDARKVSFAPIDLAVAETGMDYGGITPAGLPPDWPLLVDAAVATADHVVIGSGIRRSKLLLPGSLVGALPGAEVLKDLGA